MISDKLSQVSVPIANKQPTELDDNNDDKHNYHNKIVEEDNYKYDNDYEYHNEYNDNRNKEYNNNRIYSYLV